MTCPDLVWPLLLSHAAQNETASAYCTVYGRLHSDRVVQRVCFFEFQAGWKENHATFMCELKNLQASGLTTLGHALRTAFDLLNLNRLVSGIDNYGQVSDANGL